MVFANYGIVDASINRDDYAGLNVGGKVVVIAGSVPQELDDAKRKELENPQNLFNQIGAAIGRQPAAIVLLLPDSVCVQAAAQFAGTQIQLDKGQAVVGGPRMLPMVAVARLTGSPFVPAGWPSGQATPPAGTRFTASYTEQPGPFNGYNILVRDRA